MVQKPTMPPPPSLPSDKVTVFFDRNSLSNEFDIPMPTDSNRVMAQALVIAARECFGAGFTCSVNDIAASVDVRARDHWMYFTLSTNLLSKSWNGDASSRPDLLHLMSNAFGLFALISNNMDTEQPTVFVTPKNPMCIQVRDLVRFLD